jgi:hypothetical protein
MQGLRVEQIKKQVEQERSQAEEATAQIWSSSALKVFALMVVVPTKYYSPCVCACVYLYWVFVVSNSHRSILKLCEVTPQFTEAEKDPNLI